MADNLPMILDARGNPIQRHAGFGGDSQYDAASFKGELKNWSPFPGSADTDILPELGDIISRARDADRNQPVAKATISTMVQQVVGDGLRVVPTPNYRALGKTKEWADDWAQAVQSEADAYFGSTDCDLAGIEDFSSMTALVFQSTLMNGGTLALPHWRARSAPHRMTEYRTAFRLVEIDRLENPNGMMDTEFQRGGIDFDEDGEPIGYNILRHHPGDAIMGFTREWDHVPAWTEWGRQRVVHVFSRDRIDQHRGVPVLATVLPDLKVADDYKSAELHAAVANALVALVAESPMGPEFIRDLFGDAETYLQMRAKNSPKFKSGMMAALFPGDKLAGFTPARPNANYGGFMESVLRPVSAASGMPLELVMRNFTTMNYSSLRGMMVEVKRAASTMRSWLTRRWCNPAYALWFEEAVDRGRVPDCTLDDLYENWSAWTKSRWLGSGSGWVDPNKEADAAHYRVAYGLGTLESECADQGENWRDIADQQATERKYYASRGMAYPGDANVGKPAPALKQADEEKTNAR
ncbi:phage portal protein [Devosia faecipullorum]|uniref:phage portal protein n=1 Tax=Devosia faecipullorum TaxID=2755039 RepID=UPI00187B25D8|nr:phage portal protein [Devosia faecipullorum]MBE7732164.1 phage portal protein [Devosia faecipullorum]